MREILFRGMNGLGIWFYGNYVYCERSECHCIVVEDTSRDYQSFIVMPETVGQYTGLKDKNGKKIFEGDMIILRHNKHYWKFECSDIEGKGLYFIQLSNNLSVDDDDLYTFEEQFCDAGHRKEILFTSSKYIEIIGNIHEEEK